MVTGKGSKSVVGTAVVSVVPVVDMTIDEAVAEAMMIDAEDLVAVEWEALAVMNFQGGLVGRWRTCLVDHVVDLITLAAAAVEAS